MEPTPGCRGVQLIRDCGVRCADLEIGTATLARQPVPVQWTTNLSSESLICSPSHKESQIPNIRGPMSSKRPKRRSQGTLRIRLSFTSNPREGQRCQVPGRPARCRWLLRPAQGAIKKSTRCVGDGCIKAPAPAPFKVPLMPGTPSPHLAFSLSHKHP